jgi:excisionase family DNA binding protein
MLPIMITSEELASRLRISKATVRRWAREDRLPSVRIGRRLLFHPRTVELALGEGRPSPQPAA